MSTGVLPQQRIFMLGIGGSGMRGLALLLHAEGHQVSGTDQNFESVAQLPEMKRYTLAAEHESETLLNQADLMIYTDATIREHPLRKLAYEKHILALPFNRALGELTRRKKTIAVAGSHGKSSTSALLAHVLTEAGLDPMALIGASLPAWEGCNARMGAGEYFVVEADEYREHFLDFLPYHALITNIDFDHPDYFHSEAEVARAFDAFLQLIPAAGLVVTGESVKRRFRKLSWPRTTITVSEFDQPDMDMPLPGAHMRYNASLVAAFCEEIGLDRDDVRRFISTFAGLARRFEILGSYQGMTIVSDYGHHPAEIRQTLVAARERFSDKRIAVLFEPHTVERLKSFMGDYVSALRLADGVMVAPIFIPRGRDTTTAALPTSSDLLTKFIHRLEESEVMAELVPDYEALPLFFDRHQKDFQVILAFSAGVLDSRLRLLINSTL